MAGLAYWKAKLALRRKRLVRARAWEQKAVKNLAYRKRLVDIAEDKVQALQSGPGRAVTWAVSKKGLTESPAGSNKGPQISTWQKHWLGYDGYSWCGAFAGYALYKAGVKGLDGPSIVYTPSIVNDARAGRHGFRKLVPLSAAKKGDLVLFNWDGGVVDHVGVFTGKRFSDGSIETVEGNTSAEGSGGSQSNGGGVFVRRRYPSQIQYVARPRW